MKEMDYEFLTCACGLKCIPQCDNVYTLHSVYNFIGVEPVLYILRGLSIRVVRMIHGVTGRN